MAETDKTVGGYWVYKVIDGVVVRRRPTQQEIIEAEKASIKYKKSKQNGRNNR